MAVKPVEGHIDWTDGAPSKVIDPGAAKKLAGWLASERPPHRIMNFLLYVVDKWNKYFEEVTDAFVAQGLSFDAVIAPTGTHADFNDLMADPGIANIKRVLVATPLTVTVNQVINQPDMQFVFKPQAVITKGAGATIGLTIDAARVTLLGGRIVGFSVGGERGLRITANGDNYHVSGTRFLNNDLHVEDLSDGGLLQQIEEV